MGSLVATIRYPAGHSADDWGFIIASAQAAGVPDGDVVYMFANKVIINGSSLDRTNYLSDRKARRLARGKQKITVQAPSVWIPTHSMTELNACNAYLTAWMAKDHAPVYLWIRTKVSGSWVYYDFPSVTGAMTDYLMGYVDKNTDNLERMFLKTITFSNAYTGGA